MGAISAAWPRQQNQLCFRERGPTISAATEGEKGPAGPVLFVQMGKLRLVGVTVLFPGHNKMEGPHQS